MLKTFLISSSNFKLSISIFFILLLIFVSLSFSFILPNTIFSILNAFKIENIELENLLPLEIEDEKIRNKFKLLNGIESDKDIEKLIWDSIDIINKDEICFEPRMTPFIPGIDQNLLEINE